MRDPKRLGEIVDKIIRAKAMGDDLTGYVDTEKLGVFHPAASWQPVPPPRMMFVSTIDLLGNLADLVRSGAPILIREGPS